MIDFKALQEQRERDRRFLKTELGRLFLDYENAIIKYWKEDNNDRISDAKLKDLDQRSREATKAFKDKLMEIVGV